MKRLIVAISVAAGAASALAMPTKEELTKAQPLVAELMADDVAAFKSKSKKAEEVGDVSVKYAQEASTEAAKFLLLKGAISYYVRGEQYDKAADAVNALRSEIADVPPAVVEEIIRKNTARVTAKKAPRLFAQYQTAQVQMAAAKQIAAAKAALAKKPKDAALTRKLAEAQALSGDWKAALESFAQLNNKAGMTAQAESEGKNLPDVADFWWTYESYLGEEDADVFKSHAAEIYKKCLADGTIEGLKKNIVEKRLKQVEVAVAPVSAKEVVSDGKNLVSTKRITLKVPGEADIVLIQCPAGKFTMGFDNGSVAFTPRKVTLSRPFWMSEAPITVGQYCALMGSFDELYKPRLGIKPSDGMRKLATAMGGNESAMSGVTVEEIDSYCGKLATQSKNLIPKDYVVRLPTEAEWMYAFMCGGHVKEPNYATLAKGKAAPNYGKVGVDIHRMMPNILDQQGVTFAKQQPIWRIVCDVPCYRVKTCKPNDWGFYDLVGLCWERLADRTSSSYAGAATWNKKGDKCFADLNKRLVECGEVDPILTTDEEPGQTVCVKCSPDIWGKWVNESTRLWDVGFRLVIGPDIVGEWKAKHGKK